MIRRLSFINNFNTVRALDYTLQHHSHMDVCMNTVFYLRRPFKFTTKHRRRSWRRRKHNFEYVLYFNVLGMWSTEYVFFRNNIKFTYNYCITKTSLLVYNLADLRGTVPALAKHSEHVYMSTLSKTIVNYFSFLQVPTYRYWRNPVNTLLVFSSSYRNPDTDEVLKTCLISPGYHYSTSTLSPYRSESYYSHHDSYTNLIDSLLNTYNHQWILEFYKISTLLTLYILNKNC